MKNLTLAAATALALVFAAPAMAHPGKGGNFEKVDTNGDGVVATTEVEAAALAAFTKIDADADGFLSQDELKAGHEGKRSGKMKREGKRAGKGKDGVNIDEWIDPAKKAEWDAMKAERQAEKAERHAEMQAKGAEMFAAADTDGDGRWNKAEFTAVRLERFAKVDTNGDGNITADEREAAKAMMKENRGKWRDKPAGQ